MKLTLSLMLLLVTVFSVSADDDNKKTDENPPTVVVVLKGEENISKYPKMPAARPVSCVVTGNEIDVYCQYEATGDILVVDSRTGMTVASENAVELGDGYTLYIPEQYAQAPLTIYVTIAGTTYWGEI